MPSMPHLPSLVIFALAAAAVPACDSILPSGSNDSEDVPLITELPRSLTPDEIEVRDASNAFGFDLLRDIVAEAPDSTHFLSPFSASMALTMALNGADGETHEEMRATLRFEGTDEADINASYRGLLDLLADLDPNVSFQIANSLWHDVHEQVSDEYAERIAEVFDAAVEEADFTEPATPGLINAWVDEHTGGRIEEIVPDPIPSDVVAYLLNAIHFQGDWRYRFDPDETHDAPFHLEDGSTETVRFMRREGGYRAGGNAQVRVAGLPYGGDAYSMTIVIPNDGVSLAEVVAELDAEAWAELVEGLGDVREEGTLLLPRFTLEWERSFVETLERLGMTTAFDPGAADFTRMFPDPGVYITDVLQKTFVRVDEEGTEAAAATSIEFGRVSLPEGFAVDRPFLFAIHERLSGTVLFLGVVVEAPVE